MLLFVVHVNDGVLWLPWNPILELGTPQQQVDFKVPQLLSEHVAAWARDCAGFEKLVLAQPYGHFLVDPQ